MSQEEQTELEDQEIQNIFLNPREIGGHHRAEENRPSAPEPFENSLTQYSSDSGDSDPGLTAIFCPRAIGSIHSECGLDLSLSESSGSGSVPLTAGTPIQGERVIGFVVSSGASTSRTESLLTQDVVISGQGQEQVEENLQAGGEASTMDDIISHLLERRCLCRCCIDTLLHSGYTKSYFVKKFPDNCALCEFKTMMKDYQKICNECSRRKNLCMKCTASSVFPAMDSVFEFEKLLEGENAEIFTAFTAEIQHRIIKKVYKAFDIPETQTESTYYAEKVFQHLIEKYK